MRHLRSGVTLSRTTEHRKALFSNLVAALLTNEKIRTTHAKARETRRLTERTITLARRLGEVLTKSPERRSPEEAAQYVHAVRMARRVVRDRGAVLRLFEEIGPRVLARNGGYTRITKVGQRPGDAAPMSIVELVDRVESKAEDTAPSAMSVKGKAGGKAIPQETSAAAPAKAAKKSAAKTESAASEDSAKAEKKPRSKKA